jgi:hypothetical protein
MGTEITFFDGGRGMTAPATGEFTGGMWAKISIPAAGGYPFRLVYENGTGDGGVEWSIFQTLPDGSIARVGVNETNVAGAIQAFQASSANSGPWVSFIQPAPWAHDLQPFEPVLVKLTDGSPLTTDAGHIDGLTIDGTNQTFTASKVGSVTTVLQTSGLPWANANVGHTNILRFRDSNGTSYTNTWVTMGSAPYVNPFATFTIPPSYRVDTNSLSQPGFRIRSAQVVSANSNNLNYAEQILEGLAGVNVADQSHTNGPGFFVWTNVLDFSITPSGGPNAGGGEWTWDNCLTNGGLGQGYFVGIPNGRAIAADPGGAGYTGNLFGFLTHVSTASTASDQSQDNQVLDIAAWLVFPRPGNYILAGTSDDLERMILPYGNPANKLGLTLGQGDVGRGTVGAHYGAAGGIEYIPINITTAGAYPFRFLWENGGGGGGVEFSVWSPRADGSYIYLPINDPSSPDSIKAFQVSTNDEPYIVAMYPIPNRLVTQNTGTAQLNGGANASGYNIGGGQITGSASGNEPQIILNSGFRVNPYNGVTNDFILVLQDMPNAAVKTNTLSLTFAGISQPIIVATNPAGPGQNILIRAASQQPYWPSATYGQLMLGFTDSQNRAVTMPLAYAYSPMWGQLTNGFPLGSGDANRRGFLLRTWAMDSPGSVTKPQRVHVAEQVLAGLWTNNFANIINASNVAAGWMTNPYPPGGNYFILAGNGGNGTNGLVNFNPGGPPPGAAGSFSSAVRDSANFPYNDQPLPGIQGTNGAGLPNNNNFVAEFLTYVEFPNAGTYMLSVASDDGFRLSRGWGAANNNGALRVNSINGSSSNALVGLKATAQNTFLTSLSITSAISGNLALAQGTVGFPYGSTNWLGNGYAVDGCTINNPGALNGNIALIYRSRTSPGCNFLQQVGNAASAGAVAVVFVNNMQGTAEGWFPIEPNAFPPLQPIPAVMIQFNDGQTLAQILATNGTVNVTINPLDYMINPAAAQSPLGQADFGKGSSVASDFFPVVVPAAGIYPLRLVYEQGGGGANVEFFSIGTNNAGGTTWFTGLPGVSNNFSGTATNKVLINDDFGTNGPGLRAFYALTVPPSLTWFYDSNNYVFWTTNTGTLETNSTLYANFGTNPPAIKWVDIYNNGGGVMSDVGVRPTNHVPTRFYRAR